jgi:hypothetical protein
MAEAGRWELADWLSTSFCFYVMLRICTPRSSARCLLRADFLHDLFFYPED